MTLRQNLLVATLVLTGCGQMTQEERFRSGLPTQEMVEVKSPGARGQAAGEVSAQGKQNETSDLYKLTRGAVTTVNGGTLAVLGLVQGVTKHTPTTVSEDTAVWGPHSEALARNAWRLTVKRTAENTYTYALAAKAKEAADSEFVDVITGTQKAAVDASGEVVEGYGQGEFTLNWDKLKKLPENDGNDGSLTVKYARPDATSAVTVDAQFIQVKDEANPDRRVDARYAYSSLPGQGGQFDFKQLQNAVGSSTKQETLTIKSRWLETGAGRSDVKVSGGDLATEATLNECWNTSFASRYAKYSWAPSEGYGSEANDCAFPSAVYSSL